MSARQEPGRAVAAQIRHDHPTSRPPRAPPPRRRRRAGRRESRAAGRRRTLRRAALLVREVEHRRHERASLHADRRAGGQAVGVEHCDCVEAAARRLPSGLAACGLGRQLRAVDQEGERAPSAHRAQRDRAVAGQHGVGWREQQPQPGVRAGLAAPWRSAAAPCVARRGGSRILVTAAGPQGCAPSRRAAACRPAARPKRRPRAAGRSRTPRRRAHPNWSRSSRRSPPVRAQGMAASGYRRRVAPPHPARDWRERGGAEV